MEIRSVGAALIHAEGRAKRTEMWTDMELTSALWNYENVHSNT
jgi:hypothetical protein